MPLGISANVGHTQAVNNASRRDGPWHPARPSARGDTVEMRAMGSEEPPEDAGADTPGTAPGVAPRAANSFWGLIMNQVSQGLTAAFNP